MLAVSFREGKGLVVGISDPKNGSAVILVVTS